MGHILFTIFSNPVWTGLGAVAALIGIAVPVYFQRSSAGSAGAARAHPQVASNAERDAHLVLARRYAHAISQWFKERFALLDRFAGHDDFRTNDPKRVSRALKELYRELTEVPGGVYALADSGVVIGQYSPDAPTVGNIVGFQARERDYFRMCLHATHPVVSNAFQSANRGKEILVLATRRRSAQDSAFIGILDAVVDIDLAPFSRMAAAAKAGAASDRLLLLDANLRVIGSSEGPVDGKSGEAGNPVVAALHGGLRHRADFASPLGAIVAVADTPFFVVACRNVELPDLAPEN